MSKVERVQRETEVKKNSENIVRKEEYTSIRTKDVSIYLVS